MAVKLATTCWVPHWPRRAEYPVGVSVMDVRAGSTAQLVKGITAPSSNKAPNERLRINISWRLRLADLFTRSQLDHLGSPCPNDCDQLASACSGCACIAKTCRWERRRCRIWQHRAHQHTYLLLRGGPRIR